MNQVKLPSEAQINEAFETGEVYNASTDILRKYLQVLNTQGISNDKLRHRATNRCITINTIINMRFIDRVEQLNTNLAKIVIVLTILAIVIGGCTLVATIINILVALPQANLL